MSHRSWRPLLCAAALILALGCNRNVEPYAGGEQPEQPDLAKIFPEGLSRERAAQPVLPPLPGMAPPQRGAPPVVASGGAPIQGSVRLSQELEGRVPAGAVLFLIARHGQTGPPLAVKRIDAPRFPQPFSIGPDDRMMQNIPFAGPLFLSVRVDSDGDAASRAAGDMQGAAAGPLEPGARDVEIVIDQLL